MVKGLSIQWREPGWVYDLRKNLRRVTTSKFVRSKNMLSILLGLRSYDIHNSMTSSLLNRSLVGLQVLLFNPSRRIFLNLPQISLLFDKFIRHVLML